MTPTTTLLSWSSGKDSAWTLYTARQDPALKITGLLTTITETFERVSMHGVRERLLDMQALAAGLPLHKLLLPSPCSNELYEERMGRALAAAREDGVEAVVFGDIFLEDLRKYREDKLGSIGMKGLFPLWKRDSHKLAEEMIAGGLSAYIACLDPRFMPEELAGHAFDLEFLERLPKGVDPLGENGEFHTFCFKGPMFSKEVEVEVGQTVTRDGFVFTDLR